MDLRKRLETVDAKKGEDLKAHGSLEATDLDDSGLGFRKRLNRRLKLQLVHEEEAVKKALLRDQFPSAVAVKRMASS